jgi:hypothetical protein
VVGQGHLAGSGDLAAADQARDGDGVVRGSERPDPDQPGVRAEQAGGGEHLGDLERLVLLERREQAGEASGQHRLAGARRAGEEQVVGAGGGDLEGAAGLPLAADVGEVLDRRVGGAGRGAGAAEVGPAGQPLPDLPEGGGAGDPQVGDQRRLGQVGLGDDQEPGARPAGGQGGREHALDRADVAAEAELADGPQAVEGGRRHRPGRGQQPDGDGQVEPGALLGQVGRWEGHGDAPVGPLVAGVAERGPQPVARLQDGGAAEPDHGHGGQAPPDVDLDPDRVCGEADQCGRGQPGQHPHSTPFRCSTRGRP